MIYHTYLPAPALAPYIRCYWTLESEGHPAQTRERIFPDGCTELVFHCGDLFKKYRQAHTADLQPRSFVHGQLTGFIEIEPTGKTGIFSVRFQPGGLRPFIDVDMNEITGLEVGLRELWNQEGEILEDRMLNARNDRQRIAILEAFFIARLTEKKQPDDLIGYCLQAMSASGGSLPMQQLADELNITRRHLERRFVSGVGIPPKLLSRIIRFQHTLQLIESPQFTNLTMAAYDGGFYDQAHFIKDFKAFTGLNPRQYFLEESAWGKYLTLTTPQNG